MLTNFKIDVSINYARWNLSHFKFVIDHKCYDEGLCVLSRKLIEVWKRCISQDIKYTATLHVYYDCPLYWVMCMWYFASTWAEPWKNRAPYSYCKYRHHHCYHHCYYHFIISCPPFLFIRLTKKTRTRDNKKKESVTVVLPWSNGNRKTRCMQWRMTAFALANYFEKCVIGR